MAPTSLLNEKLIILTKKREKLFIKLQSLVDLVKTLNKDTFHIFKARYDHIHTIHESFEAALEETDVLNLSLPDEEHQVNTSELSKTFDQLYYFVISEANKYKPLSQEPATKREAESMSKPSIRLPKINLPTYEGSLTNWCGFKATYLSLIHNNASLNPVDKYNYLRSSLSGSALDAISSIPFESNSYSTAWDALLKRFDNKRLLAFHYLEKIFDFTTLRNSSPVSLQNFLSVYRENIAALNKLAIPNLEKFIFLHIGLRKLDSATRYDFETESRSSEFPTSDDLVAFLETKCKILQMSSLTATASPLTPRLETSGKRRAGVRINSFVGSDSYYSCPLCSGRHKLIHCHKFLKYSPPSRHQFAKSHNICYNCLSSEHRLADCSSPYRCKSCNARHHSLLHLSNSKSPSRSPEPSGRFGIPHIGGSHPTSGIAEDTSRQHQGDTSTVLQTTSFSNSSDVLLGTTLLHIMDAFGQWIPFRAILDCGSQRSFLTQSFVSRLGFQPLKSRVMVAGIGPSPTLASKGVIKTVVSPRLDRSCEIPFTAEILPTLTNRIPTAPLPEILRRKYCNLELADPFFDTPASVDGLLGNDIFTRALLQHQPHLNSTPAALSTIFGYVIMGPLPDSCISLSNSLIVSLFVNEPSSLPELHSVIEKFWVLEEPAIKPLEDPEHVQCERHFVETHSRDESGRYVVRYPFRNNSVSPSCNYQLSLNRLVSQERKFKMQPPQTSDYQEFLKEYLALGHMVPTTEESRYIIPHHAVYKPDSLTTKTRVVFDASAKRRGDLSLNDCLMAGPTIQCSLADIVCNFRLHPIVFTADITKMYRQVLIHPDDQCYQHILWRRDQDSPINTFALRTVTYGVKSASFQAIRSLVQLSLDEGAKYPLAARILQEDLHVDDVVSGAQSLEDALSVQRELSALCASGGFTLHKWLSNSPSFLDAIASDTSTELSFAITVDSDSVHKVLGIQWHPKLDVFSYSFNDFEVGCTKRSILSNIARLFDPLGWIAPVVFLAKCLMQKLWRLCLNWDDPAPDHIVSTWRDFVCELSSLGDLRIPRFVLSLDLTSCHILGFCDASELGYGCAIYVRSRDSENNTRMSLLKARTRVAPLKLLTIPRLELCGALLLVRTLVGLKSCLERYPPHSIHLWTDSTTVLSWLSIETHRMKTFVAHRIEEINQSYPRAYWSHVATEDNPADFASRGLLPGQVISSKLWWNGPSWASSPPEVWPSSRLINDTEDITELKPTHTVAMSACDPNPFIDLIGNFSKLSRLTRIVGWITRFCRNSRSQHRKVSGDLHLFELREATLTCIKCVQATHFHQELEDLASKRTLRPSLQALAPFVDSSGFLRVGGRLSSSSLPWSTQHPLLLPKTSHLTKLLVEHYHIFYLHVGAQTLQALLSRTYWIISARNLIRKVVRECPSCFKFRAKPLTPLMGDLPLPRVSSPGRPFTHVGVDFAGPFLIKTSNLRKAPIDKAYFCVFVCMATKALHIELVSSLSSESFLACLDRFSSRRGAGHHFYSDHGTNFVGAARQLKETRDFLLSVADPSFEHYLNSRNIIWHFNPPLGPHFGGLWEAAVKSVKTHLVRLTKSQPLSFEELTTVLTKIEAILNSRPLCPLSTDPSDFSFLTPGHFLVGGPLVALPQTPLVDVLTNRLRRWQLVQQICQRYWHRWSTEYLQTLQARQKWTKNSTSLQLGDLVLLKSPNSPVLHWLTGRVIQIHPGGDGVVRVVTVRTSSGEYKRPVASLVPFPSESHKE